MHSVLQLSVITALLAGISTHRGRVFTQSEPPGAIVIKQVVAVRSGGRAGRSPIHQDAVEAMIVAGSWTPPSAGDKLVLPEGTAQTWQLLQADKNNQFSGPPLNGGYAYARVDSATAKSMVLEAAGHSMVYVNGEPRAGDPYEYGYVHLPVHLRAGQNHLLFLCGRGKLRARLVPPKASIFIDTSDLTAPDLMIGEAGPNYAAVVIVNGATAPAENLVLVASRVAQAPTVSAIPTIPPLSSRKVPYMVEGPTAAGQQTEEIQLDIYKVRGNRRERLDTAIIKLNVRDQSQSRKRTFVSKIDSSVQYYAVKPPRGRFASAENPAGLPGSHPPALFLTLHGAGVEATGQADAYAPKTWGYVVAPTNRRPYGFDWEDWGRMDALEALEHASAELKTDPSRTYLTGHSMGGHGVWQVGVTNPDLFAALGPSAGWSSFFSYAGGSRIGGSTPVAEILNRAANPSDTLLLARNYLRHGIYILHGDADDNVPVGEAREMVKRLSEFHHDFTAHEQKGAGHWWDASDEPGTDCVDWAPMFDLFARHVRPDDDEVREIEFFTANPGVSSTCHWVSIEQQSHPLRISSVKIRYDAGKARYVGTTNNVERLAITVKHMDEEGPIQVELDGQKLSSVPWPAAGRAAFVRENGVWAVSLAPLASLKGPQRSGPFKDAFRNRMLFVYGTKGGADENAWSFARARYDAETFWYRGNGSVDIIPDTAFQPGNEIDRNVIIYGNADTNGAWKMLLSDSPVQVRKGFVQIGDRLERGFDLACLFIRPRSASETASVGVVAGTGISGMRLTDRMPYFVSGVHYPDVTVIGSEMLTTGIPGVRAAGFFGNDWSVATGEFAWRDIKAAKAR